MCRRTGLDKPSHVLPAPWGCKAILSRRSVWKMSWNVIWHLSVQKGLNWSEEDKGRRAVFKVARDLHSRAKTRYLKKKRTPKRVQTDVTANQVEHVKSNSAEQGLPRRDALDFSNILRRAMHLSRPSNVLFLLFCVHFNVFPGRHRISNFIQFKKTQKFKFSQFKKKEQGPSRIEWITESR